MQATLNVRMDATLKERGENVLRENGVTTSQAVRALWSYLAQSNELPAFMNADARRDDERARKRSLLLALAGAGEGACSELTDAEMERIYGQRFA